MAEEETIVAYWLLPAEPARSELALIIRELAGRFDAPIFEPHVTVYVTSSDRENPAAVLGRVLPTQQPFRLTARGVDYLDEFTKTLFIQFAPDPGLSSFAGELHRASVSPSDYELNPHLSLIYKAMTRDNQRNLATSMNLPSTEIEFDVVRAVVSPSQITTRADVEAWRVVAEGKLGE